MKRHVFIAIIATTLFSCVQNEHLKTVTFKVDMSEVDTIGEVALKGAFTDPAWDASIKMSDDDGDLVYEVTVSQETAQNSVEFKFTHNDVYELQKLPNRVLKMNYQPEEIVYTGVFNNEKGEQINSN